MHMDSNNDSNVVLLNFFECSNSVRDYQKDDKRLHKQVSF